MPRQPKNLGYQGPGFAKIPFDAATPRQVVGLIYSVAQPTSVHVQTEIVTYLNGEGYIDECQILSVGDIEQSAYCHRNSRIVRSLTEEDELAPRASKSCPFTICARGLNCRRELDRYDNSRDGGWIRNVVV